MTQQPRSWAAPDAGQIVWCRFPEDQRFQPSPKPRPALILTVFDDEDPDFRVLVAYGTSQKTERLYAGEFRITPAEAEAYALAGLSFPTKFNLKAAVELPYDTTWFAIPPAAPFGQTPKLGVLHPSLHRRAAAAWKASRAPR